MHPARTDTQACLGSQAAQFPPRALQTEYHFLSGTNPSCENYSIGRAHRTRRSTPVATCLHAQRALRKPTKTNRGRQLTHPHICIPNHNANIRCGNSTNTCLVLYWVVCRVVELHAARPPAARPARRSWQAKPLGIPLVTEGRGNLARRGRLR